MDGAVDARGVDAPGVDAPTLDVPGVDAPGIDAPAPDVPGVDAGRDAGGMRNYLDRCTTDVDCTSNRCVPDTDGTRFCSRSCSAHGDCADEHVCASNVCVPDDTGDACSTGSPGSCALGLCIGAVGGAAHCTRQCGNATECPAGFACTRISGMKICVEVEKPCTAAGNECGTSLCIPSRGCTSTCDGPADCPQRPGSVGATAYTCEFDSGLGMSVCIPPEDIMGSDRMGTLCPSSGTNACRSGLCADLNEADGIPHQCIQGCAPEGGCPDGWACQPQVVEVPAPVIQAFCVPGGTGALGAPCGRGADCASGLCDDPGSYCTRFCTDGFCPTGWTCTPVSMSPYSICRR